MCKYICIQCTKCKVFRHCQHFHCHYFWWVYNTKTSISNLEELYMLSVDFVGSRYKLQWFFSIWHKTTASIWTQILKNYLVSLIIFWRSYIFLFRLPTAINHSIKILFKYISRWSQLTAKPKEKKTDFIQAYHYLQKIPYLANIFSLNSSVPSYER